MPLLALLILACQAACVLHFLRSDQERFWIYLIISLPGVGCLTYFLMVILPEFLSSRTGQRTVKHVHDQIDPERHLRVLHERLEICDSREVRLELANELIRLGRPEEAVKHIQHSLQGIDQDAPDLLLALANAHFAMGNFTACRWDLERLIEKNPSYRSAEGHLLYAQALHSLRETEKAEEEYRALCHYYAGPAAMYHYALMLEETGRITEAKDLHEQIQLRARRAGKHYRTLHNEWLKQSRKKLTTLQTTAA